MATVGLVSDQIVPGARCWGLGAPALSEPVGRAEGPVKEDEGRNTVLRPPVLAFAWFGNVPRLGPLRTVDDLEFDLLVFFESPEARALNRGKVHEDVVSPFAFDETVTFSVVEPLDLARNTHRTCLPCENCSGESATLTKKRPHTRSQRQR